MSAITIANFEAGFNRTGVILIEMAMCNVCEEKDKIVAAIAELMSSKERKQRSTLKYSPVLWQANCLSYY
tara:strand:- start:653 stop:862 length:210 start_codon:yes stop_codon:yes gene_type:complete